MSFFGDSLGGSLDDSPLAKVHFGPAEDKRLAELYEVHRAVLLGTDNASAAQARRLAKWKEITDVINSKFGCGFNCAQVTE